MRKSLFGQIYFYFTVVILLSITGVGVVSYVQSTKALEDQVERYISQLIRHSTSQTESYLRRYELATDSLLSEDAVKRFMEMDPNDSYRFYELTETIQKNLFRKTFIAYPSAYSITIIGDHGKAIIDDNRNWSTYENFDAKKTLAKVNARVPKDGKIAIYRDGEDDRDGTITIARRIRGYATYEPKGVLVMRVRTDQLAPLWDMADLGESAALYISDESGRIVYGPSEPGSVSGVELAAVLSRLPSGAERSVIESIGGEPTLFVTRESSYLKWNMIVSLPVDELRRPVGAIRTTTWMVGLATLLIALLLAYRFGRTITRPIRTVMEGMRETEKGIWSRIDDGGRDDELGGLIHRYNLMVSRLSEMIDRVYDAELQQQKSDIELHRSRFERQQAEFHALQLQINPHFLYNTLETINCYAIVQDSEEIAEIVEAMAYMLRYSVQTHLEEITLVNELNHVRNYMVIMGHRLGSGFELDVAVPPALLLRHMVRLTLQPLVENALQHAFRDGMEPHHYIRINAEETEDELRVYVEDNGVGIPPQKLALLRERLAGDAAGAAEAAAGRSEAPVEGVAAPGAPSASAGAGEATGMSSETGMQGADGAGAAAPRRTILRRGGIGVVNVHRRIRMVYGDEYGLTIDSKEGQGSRFTMRMPRRG
ncbi:cache domain-containing sensor histidine kinase [Paenibacillus sp.]|uniref:cache domain-containing sensor histidine kinase n=1 Tax=Paenibacillus sp. TaxID=58172 RepID=UPI002D717989|nr:histidine kinase [Paenibacillus sp.]HZG57399.1 histidine kinase [Paenibacillus sp.]